MTNKLKELALDYKNTEHMKELSEGTSTDDEIKKSVFFTPVLQLVESSLSPIGKFNLYIDNYSGKYHIDNMDFFCPLTYNQNVYDSLNDVKKAYLFYLESELKKFQEFVDILKKEITK